MGCPKYVESVLGWEENSLKFENHNIKKSKKMTTSPPLFTVGDIVLVDNTNKAYITNIRGEVGDQFLKYTIL